MSAGSPGAPSGSFSPVELGEWAGNGKESMVRGSSGGSNEEYVARPAAAAGALAAAVSQPSDPELQLVSPLPPFLDTSTTTAAAKPDSSSSSFSFVVEPLTPMHIVGGETEIEDEFLHGGGDFGAEGVAIDMPPPLTSFSAAVVAAANSVATLASSPLLTGFDTSKSDYAVAAASGNTTPVPHEPDGPLDSSLLRSSSPAGAAAASSSPPRRTCCSAWILLLLGLTLTFSLLALGYASVRSGSGVAASLSFGLGDDKGGGGMVIGRQALIQQHLLPARLTANQRGAHFAAADAHRRARAARAQQKEQEGNHSSFGENIHLSLTTKTEAISSPSIATASRPSDDMDISSSAAAAVMIDVREDVPLLVTSTAVAAAGSVDQGSTTVAQGVVSASASASASVDSAEQQSWEEGVSTEAVFSAAASSTAMEADDELGVPSSQPIANIAATGAATGDAGDAIASSSLPFQEENAITSSASSTTATASTFDENASASSTGLSTITETGSSFGSSSSTTASSEFPVSIIEATGRTSSTAITLPDPPVSFGSFLLVTAYGRESNRFLQVLESARWALITKRRLIHFPYDGTHLDQMYDLADLDARMRQARVALGEAPWPREEELPYVLSYDQYMHQVLGLPVPDVTLSINEHWDDCFAVKTVHCSRWEMERNSCIPLFSACHFSDIPFRDAPLIRTGPTDALKQAKAANDAVGLVAEVQSLQNETLLVLSGGFLWDIPFPIRAPNLPQALQTSVPSAASSSSSSEQLALVKMLLEDLHPNLHPNMMSRSAAVLRRLPPAADVPSLALHIRTGDLREQVLSVPARMELALRIVREEWKLDLARLRVYIATDSDRAEEIEAMRQAFGATAQIGGIQLLEAQAAGEAAPKREPGVMAVLLDKAMCIQADYFIGSLHSSYSMVIQMLRHRQPGFVPKHQTQI